MLTPFFFLYDVTGRQYAPPTDYPHFFYGFLLVTMAWQMVFLVIGSNPLRFRLLMIPSVVEKLGYILALAILFSQVRISANDAAAAWPACCSASSSLRPFHGRRPRTGTVAKGHAAGDWRSGVGHVDETARIPPGMDRRGL